MSEYDNKNSGALFKNKDKTKDTPNWADYQGSLEVECPHCQKRSNWWLSAWLKVSKKKESFMSVTIREKTGKKASPQTPATQKDEFEDDIPF